jgi:RecB family exonuclease
MRPLSHSSIQTFLECPQRWKLKYVDRLPEKPRHFFSFGKTMHSALEYFYGVQVLPPPGIDELLRHYREKWEPEGYKSPKDEAKFLAEGERILREYHAKHSESFKLPLFVEYQFTLDLKDILDLDDLGDREALSRRIESLNRAAAIDGGRAGELSAGDIDRLRDEGVKVTGFVDRVDKNSDGTLSILDYKTGKAFDLSRVRGDSQMTMYQMAVSRLVGLPVASLTLYHLPSLTPVTSGPHAPERVEALRARIASVAGSILRGSDTLADPQAVEGARTAAFPPRVSERNCAWCDFKPHCPAWSAAFPPREGADAPALRNDEQLSRSVDRYGSLKEQIHALEGQADDVRARIEATLDEKGFSRAFGSTFELVREKREDRWEFHDRDKVKGIIRDAGFWDKIVGPQMALVQKLMIDPNLPMDLRERLGKLGKKTPHSTLRVSRIQEEE